MAAVFATIAGICLPRMKGVSMKFDINILVGLGGVAVGLVGVGYAIGSRKKLNDISERLDTKIDEISWNLESDVRIEESVVSEAIDRAVERRVTREVDREVKRIADNTRRTIDSEVRSSIRAVYPDIRKSVTDKIMSEVAKISARDLANDIREGAKEKVVEKFDRQLDDILEKFNTDLDNVSKIYTSIARKISGSDGSRDFKISLS